MAFRRKPPQKRPHIVVLNFGSADLVEHNLSRTSAENPDSPVILVDNYSSDEELERVAELATRKGWTLLPSPVNGGFGMGINLGVNAAVAAGAEEILVLNPDAYIDGASVALLSAAVAGRSRALASPRIIDSHDKVWFAGADVYLSDGSTRGKAKRPLFPEEESWEWLSGACMLIPRDTWLAAGGFDERYFLYWEDVDFSRRVARAGGELLVVESALAVHDEGGTHGDVAQGSRAKSATYYYYNIRNRMLFASLHLDAAGVRRWRRGSVGAAREILLRGGRRQFLKPLSPVRAAWRGVRDGRRLAATSQTNTQVRKL